MSIGFECTTKKTSEKNAMYVFPIWIGLFTDYTRFLLLNM